MIEISTDNNDDLTFAAIVEKILGGFVRDYSPDEIDIIKIDNWFDSKWRLFAGKIVGAAGVWSSELVVPPFIPDRVLDQSYFKKSDEFYVRQDAASLHFYQPSEKNTSRKIKAFSDSKMYLWFSGNSEINQRGSIMIYYVEEANQKSWYLSFLKKDNWQIYKTDQISRNEVLNLIT